MPYLCQLWDEGPAVLPPELSLDQQCPVMYRKVVYYLSSPAARDRFMADPEKYIRQQPPGSLVPIRLAILGPPKSGKTTGNVCVWTMYTLLCTSLYPSYTFANVVIFSCQLHASLPANMGA